MLFADLKGSMELLADRDPEEARQLLDPVLERMMEAVHRYEGTVNQVMGDGIMALFGAPLAHEDHAVRACYAALAMQDGHAAATPRRCGAPRACAVQIRVGLNSGEVVVRAIGNDLHMDYTAVGQTTHLAARMEQLATPGSILLTAGDAAAGRRAMCRSRRWGRCRSRAWRSRWRSSSWSGPVPCGGAYRRRRRGGSPALSGATAGAGRLCSRPWSGPGPGTARSWRWSASPGWASRAWSTSSSTRTTRRAGCVLESGSVSYGKATPYLPVIDLLKRYCQIEDRDDPRTVRAKVTGQVLTLDEALQDTVPAAPGAAGRCRTTVRSWRSTRRSAASAPWRRSSACCCARARCSRCCWSSRTCTGSTPRRRPCSTAWSRACRRPGSCSWSTTAPSTSTAGAARPTTRSSGSTRCRRRAPTSFLQALLGDDPSLAPLKQLLIARTEGNPFFLEESVRTLVETGVLVGERGRLSPGASRCDHAGAGHGAGGAGGAHRPAAAGGQAPAPDRRGHRHGGALGRCCRPSPSCPRRRCTAAWRTCRRPSSSTRRSLFPELEYTFKHALTHEVAYGSLLQERRRALHARIVEALETLAGDRLDEQVERLAHHALRGEVWDKAVAYCRQAGDEGHGALGLPRGGGVLRAGAGGPRSISPSSRDTHRAGHRSPARPAHRAPAARATWGGSWHTCAKPRPSPRPSTTRVGWDRSLPFCHSISGSWARYDQAIDHRPARPGPCHGQRGCRPAGAGEPAPWQSLRGPD